MIVKRHALPRALALLALFSLVTVEFLDQAQSAQANTSSSKKHKRRHKPSYTNMSLVPPPPPSVAIPEGMLLSVPPPPAMMPVSFNPYQTQMSMSHTGANRCAHCGFTNSTYLAPTNPSISTSPFYKPFPRRTFFNADSMTSVAVSRSRKTRSERLTRRLKKRKCIFATR